MSNPEDLPQNLEQQGQVPSSPELTRMGPGGFDEHGNVSWNMEKSADTVVDRPVSVVAIETNKEHSAEEILLTANDILGKFQDVTAKEIVMDRAELNEHLAYQRGNTQHRVHGNLGMEQHRFNNLSNLSASESVKPFDYRTEYLEAVDAEVEATKTVEDLRESGTLGEPFDNVAALDRMSELRMLWAKGSTDPDYQKQLQAEVAEINELVSNIMTGNKNDDGSYASTLENIGGFNNAQIIFSKQLLMVRPIVIFGNIVKKRLTKLALIV